MATSTRYGLGLACFAVAVAMAGATRFQVGGANGWSVPPAGAESLNTWAERTRFQIGDTLEFVYPKDQDSVLLVEPADYNACNTSSYVKKFADGDTIFTLDRSGALFFISGVEANCRTNEKVIVMVLAAGRNGTGGGAPAPSSTPSSPPPAPSTVPPPSSPSSPPPPPASSSSPPPPSPPAPAPKAPATPASPPSPGSAPPPASVPTATPGTPPPASASPPPAAPISTPPPSTASSPAQGTTNSTGSSPPPAGSKDRNGAAITVATGLASSLGACVLGYAMLAL